MSRVRASSVQHAVLRTNLYKSGNSAPLSSVIITASGCSAIFGVCLDYSEFHLHWGKLVENRSRLGAFRRWRCSLDPCFHVGDNAGRYRRRPAACMNPSVCSAKSSLIIYVRIGPAGIELGGWVAVFAVPGSLIFPMLPAINGVK